MESGKTFRDYVTEYQCKAKNDEIRAFSQSLGLDAAKPRSMMNSGVSEANINEYGKFDELKATVESEKAESYFERIEGIDIAPFKVEIKKNNLLQEYILKGGFEIRGK